MSLSYENWLPTRKGPDHFIENCVVMGYSHAGAWNDTDCASRHGYFCEYGNRHSFFTIYVSHIEAAKTFTCNTQYFNSLTHAFLTV